MYPVGTKCLIIYDTSTPSWVNREVIVTELYFSWEPGKRDPRGAPGETMDNSIPKGTMVQGIGIMGSIGEAAFPVNWLLPLDDTDTSIMEDAEEIKRLADEILS